MRIPAVSCDVPSENRIFLQESAFFRGKNALIFLRETHFSAGKPIFVQLSLGGLRIMNGSLLSDEKKATRLLILSGEAFSWTEGSSPPLPKDPAV